MRYLRVNLAILGLWVWALSGSTALAQATGAPADPLDSAFEDPDTADDLDALDDDDFGDFLPGAEAEDATEDPLEDINRPIFEMNLALDRYIFRPVTRMYMEAPQPARTGVSNVLDNLETPVILINDVLQGEMSRTGARRSSVIMARAYQSKQARAGHILSRVLRTHIAVDSHLPLRESG